MAKRLGLNQMISESTWSYTQRHLLFFPDFSTRCLPLGLDSPIPKGLTTTPVFVARPAASALAGEIVLAASQQIEEAAVAQERHHDVQAPPEDDRVLRRRRGSPKKRPLASVEIRRGEKRPICFGRASKDEEGDFGLGRGRKPTRSLRNFRDPLVQAGLIDLRGSGLAHSI